MPFSLTLSCFPDLSLVLPDLFHFLHDFIWMGISNCDFQLISYWALVTLKKALKVQDELKMSNVLKVGIFLILCCWLLQRTSNYCTLYHKYLQWAFLHYSGKSSLQLRGLMEQPLVVDVKNLFCVEWNFSLTQFSLWLPAHCSYSQIVTEVIWCFPDYFWEQLDSSIHMQCIPTTSNNKMPQRCFVCPPYSILGTKQMKQLNL